MHVFLVGYRRPVTFEALLKARLTKAKRPKSQKNLAKNIWKEDLNKYLCTPKSKKGGLVVGGMTGRK
jgi:hypothetical protein